MAACAGRSKVLSDWIDGRGQIVSEPEVVKHAYEMLRRKYDLMMKLGDLLSKLLGRYDKRATGYAGSYRIETSVVGWALLPVLSLSSSLRILEGSSNNKLKGVEGRSPHGQTQLDRLPFQL